MFIKNMIWSIYISKYQLDMKILLIVILFLSAGLFSYSQSEINKPNKNKTGPGGNKIILSASPNLLYYTPNGTQIAGGIKAQIFL